MPFVPNTPESLLDRADSKNPNSTCRGITSSGRPCRRPVTAPVSATLTPKRRRGCTVDLSDESLYCWQHKEQATHSSRSSPGPRRSPGPILEERTSLDTLADRLGVLELQDEKKQQQNGRRPTNMRPPSRPNKPDRPTLQFCFCFSIPLEETQPPARPRPRPHPAPIQKPMSASMPDLQNRLRLGHAGTPSYQRIATPSSSPGKASYRSGKSNASQTAHFKHLIPDSLDMATASTLMAELAKPHTDAEESGYIYMFWLTPTDKQSPPPVYEARSLLAPPSDASPRRSQRSSDVVSAFSAPRGGSDKKTMLLKIGRAANVQRRMNQWQRQCGYDIEMLRYYPYVAGAEGRPSSSRTPRMTPHCKRVERLIHIELAGMGLRANLDSCDACGRDHREWFEVEATRNGIRSIDDVIRRWVDWDETTADSSA
ncbi:DNA-binding protein [Moelleriella libera RCEF 2490]|uniref:DNA-binding protein n=1 Tax=Moelleriella libera RCEF 2490 TaxID=1081109 RepID=A0A168FCQ5_9HYPO|nr:DNA-binding protein [Moelleriella libera RCEF 2490]